MAQQLVQIGFNVQGEQQVSRAFLAFENEVEDMSTPLDRMSDVVLASVRAQFGTEGKSGLGQPWTPLNPDYAEWKLARYGPKPILVRTGGMKGVALNKRQTVTVTKKRMVYEPKGWGGELMSFHQEGAGRLPARKMVILTTAQKRESVDRVFSQWLHEVRVAVRLAGA